MVEHLSQRELFLFVLMCHPGNFNLGGAPLQRKPDRVHGLLGKREAAVAVRGQVPVFHLEGPLARLVALLDEMLRPTLFEDRYQGMRDAVWS